MKPSLRALLTDIVDYAGLFPPAQLPLEQAIANYARYRESPDAWMLGRFVCPAAKLANVSAFHDDLLNSGPPFKFSVLGPSALSVEEWREGLKDAVQNLKDFCRLHGDRVAADVLELRIPDELVQVSDPRGTANRLGAVRAMLESEGLRNVTVFFEFGFDLGENGITTVFEAITLYNRGAPVRAGFKLRCGGTSAKAVPTAKQVAFIIRNSLINGIALKATAGLHHPFPHFDSTLNTRMHGFINVFGGAVLSYARHSLPVGILDGDVSTNFVFSDTGFQYGIMHASLDEIAAARKESITSFGSCSFDEPREDLRALGWLS
jgi:hypothetical protein